MRADPAVDRVLEYRPCMAHERDHRASAGSALPLDAFQGPKEPFALGIVKSCSP
jgi:hypothetical protein